MKLEKSIKELHDMFLDMAMLVESQGELLNNIEHHVTNAQTYVEQGRVQAKKALEFQGKARTVRFKHESSRTFSES